MELNNAYNFLCDIKFNNNRPWFKENNDRYQTAKAEFGNFIDALIPKIKAIDDSIEVQSSKECVFRIFRDARFSKNKDPYKTNFGASIAKGGRKSGNAGYYIHIEPDNSFIGGGIYQPDSAALKAIRTSIYENPQKFKDIIRSSKFKKYFGDFHGAKLKTAPRGFPKDFEDVDLIRHKHYAVIRMVDDEFWFDENVLDNISKVFEVQYGLNAYLNEVISKLRG